MYAASARVHRLIALAVAGALASGTAAAGTTSPVPRSPLTDLTAAGARLPEAARDPLVPFHLELGASMSQVARVTAAEVRGELRSHRERYVHLGMTAADALGAASFRGPAGLPVLDGDFFFHDGEKLVEATFLLESPAGTDEAREAMRRCLGRPSFSVTLPAGGAELVGWRSGPGYVIATFNDLPVFRVSVFPDHPADIFAGSQILLFEGLQRFHDRLAAGDAPSALLDDLMRVFTGANSARSQVEPVR
ncbi:MAG: hypothetical protein MUF27_07100 [Acidobacteria bacterium]|nr:hypothetical protein [Acidobacteriota bacterium]